MLTINIVNMWPWCWRCECESCWNKFRWAWTLNRRLNISMNENTDQTLATAHQTWFAPMTASRMLEFDSRDENMCRAPQAPHCCPKLKNKHSIYIEIVWYETRFTWKVRFSISAMTWCPPNIDDHQLCPNMCYTSLTQRQHAELFCTF